MYKRVIRKNERLEKVRNELLLLFLFFAKLKEAFSV